MNQNNDNAPIAIPLNAYDNSAHTAVAIPIEALSENSPRPTRKSSRQRVIRMLRALVVEFVCTTIFVFFAIGGAVDAQRFGSANFAANIVVALAQGFGLIIAVSAAASTSGGHLNPAVTLGAFISGCISWYKALLYVFVQLAGGITAAGLLRAVLPSEHRELLGATTLGSGISLGRAFLFETILTFTLVFVVLSTTVCPGKRNGAVGRLAALPIGFTLAAALLISWPYTGTSLNPARSFGPSLISGNWDAHWIYWVAPLLGGLLAGLFDLAVIMPATGLRRADPQFFVIDNRKVQEQLPPNRDAPGNPVL